MQDSSKRSAEAEPSSTAYDAELVRNVRPSDWRNPDPRPYNLVVIGGGTAGLVTAAGAAGLGARVALVERARLGGDCLNVGCVPSKALLRSARAAAEARRAVRYGVRCDAVSVDFAVVMERMRRLRAELSPTDSAERFRSLGVDVYFGEARFVAADALRVEGAVLRFSRACIATGARPALPSVPGLDGIECFTNETIFALTSLPGRLAVIGGGPIGCELAQAFGRFGAQVVVIEAANHLLGNDDATASTVIERVLRGEGIDVRLATKLVSASASESEKRLRIEHDGAVKELVIDSVLIAAGRTPNVESLQLETAGVAYDERGIRVDRNLRTTNRRIFAAGDVCLPQRFTHTADASARIVIRNALFFGRARFDHAIVPWCTYTDPEVAHVGLTERQAAERGIALRTLTVEMADVDRARLEGEEIGFLQVHVRAGSDEIVGATMVSSHAGETISEITAAMVAKLGLSRLADIIHCYPTQAEAVRKAADAYNRSRLTPRLKNVLARWMAIRR